MAAKEKGPLASPGYHLWHASLVWTRAVADALLEVGLTHTQFFVLGAARWLGRGGTPPTQREVADFVGVDANSTSQVVRALAARGLLTREDSPGDTRAWRLRPTAEGDRAVVEAARAVRDVDARLFGPIGEQLPAFVHELEEIRKR